MVRLSDMYDTLDRRGTQWAQVGCWVGGLGLLIVSGCSGDSEPAPVEQLSFQLEQSSLDPAILAVAPVGDEIFAVGGPLVGNDPPALWLRQGEAWSSLTAPAGWQGAAWWSWSSSPDDVWVVGAQAQIARGALNGLTKVDGIETSTSVTFYGVWGLGPNDVYIVGGDPRAAGGPVGVLLHYDGQSIRDISPPAADGRVLFKVWGTGADDVMIVGTGGLALSYDGTEWTMLDTGLTEQLTTVHGRGSVKVAVGGQSQGRVLRYDGQTWTDIAEPFAPPLSGVFVAADDRVWVAGESGYLAVWDGADWTQVDTQVLSAFHAVSAIGNEVYGVGGFLGLSAGPRQGFIGRWGP